MNEVKNDILKNQYLRFLNGEIIKFKDGLDYLVSKGYQPINFSEFKRYMKKEGVEL